MPISSEEKGISSEVIAINSKEIGFSSEENAIYSETFRRNSLYNKVIYIISIYFFSIARVAHVRKGSKKAKRNPAKKVSLQAVKR